MTNRRERRASAKDARAEAKRQRKAAPDPALAEAARLYQGGRHDDAERICRRVLAASAREPYAHYLLGMIAIATGRQPLAEASLAEAVKLRPQEPAIHNGMALLRAAQGRFTEALASHDRALVLDAGDVGALIGRALALAELGNLAEAERSLARARGIAPQSAEAARNHATVLAELGRAEEAARALTQALALDPALPGARATLVELLLESGRTDAALSAALEGMRRTPQARDVPIAFAHALLRRLPTEHDPEIVRGIERCFDVEDIDHADLAKPAALQLRAIHGLDSAEDAVGALLRDGVLPPVLADGLLARLLARTVNRDPRLERFLTAARRRLAFAEPLPSAAAPFLASLALQCFNNNYVFAPGEDEEHMRASRQAALDAELRGRPEPGPALERRLLLSALYAPLASLAGAADLAETAQERWSPHFRAVLQRTLLEPLEEREIAREIPSLGASDDATSQAVAQQYEEHPYPRWFALPRPLRTRLPAVLRQKFPEAALPDFLAGPLDILIAGAGTGIQPITTALSVEDAEVLAVDLSRASLAYAERMARRLRIENLKFLQGDLLRLGELGREFPVIEAVGVLHHLREPIAGWRVLAGMLRQGGWMRVGLYSEAARAEVVAARERIAALGLTPIPADIRRFRERVLFGDEAAEFPQLALSKDIWDLSGCRDLLFHACEHRFTLPQIGAMLGELGLDFMGFEHEVAAIPRRYRTDHPDDPAMTDLGNWARFEAAHPEAFPMYVFWCAKR